MSGAPTLDKVLENGEVNSGTMAEMVENYKLATYAKIFGLSRQAVINDDLGAFSDFFRKFGVSAAQREAQVLVDLLYGTAGVGPAMSDGKALFHTDHANLSASGAAIAVTALDQARAAMRLQKDLDGVTVLNVAPKFIIVPAAKETTAQQAVAQIVPSLVQRQSLQRTLEYRETST